MSTSNSVVPYHDWSREQLISRLIQLESLTPIPTHPPRPCTKASKIPPQKVNPFDHSKYTSRLIALKFAYLGKEYNGLEYHSNNETPLPTVEEILWQALWKSRLISPVDGEAHAANGRITWEGCDYSKCGRTDRGVSAFGQVVSLRVRSRRPKATTGQGESMKADKSENELMMTSSLTTEEVPEQPPFESIRDELPYIQIINRLLPPDIRILAWCPHPPAEFSARFSCRERRYRYFFTNPAFLSSSTPPLPEPGRLDITAMQAAASKFVGLHDFRNFCKIDASKQISNFQRRIFHASIETVPSTSPDTQLYVFKLHGSAFLWHQVRHMMAILFLVGQGLEQASLVDQLLDVDAIPGKPHYTMAHDTPLVLWDCIFPADNTGVQQEQSQPDALDWVYEDEHEKMAHGGIGGKLWAQWHEREIDVVLAKTMMDIGVQRTTISNATQEATRQQTGAATEGNKETKSEKVYEGGDRYRLAGKYVPVLQRERMADVVSINQRYLNKTGRNNLEIK